METEIALYDEGIRTLTKAIESNANNKEAYFERAIAYFETGEYDLALKDFIENGKDASFPIYEEDPYLLSYTNGMISGAKRGCKDTLSEILPSIWSSWRGAGNLVWTNTVHPIDSAMHFASSVLQFYNFLLSSNIAELSDILFPEMYELIVNWKHLSPEKRGEQAGYCFGKYGIDVLLPIAGVKGVKYVKAYKEIKQAEKLCTLKTLAKSPESKLALEEAAARWNAQRLAWFERVQLEIDQQTKHIPGKWNYQEGKSIWTLSESNTQELLKKHAGKGQKITGEPGLAGYRERVDCGEIIGYFINDKQEKLPTTMATIHYSKNGAHLVPARPK